MSGRLAVVKDATTQTFLQHTLLNHFHHRGPVWIGLTNTANNSSYTWDSGQPPIADNGCVAMETNKAGVWMTFPCHMDTFADIEYPFCGDVSSNTPCTDLETVFAPFTTCPEDKPYCMNDIYHRGGLTDIFQRCVSRGTCDQEWYSQSSNKPQCTQYDHNVYSEGLECHLCCYGDSCNDDLLPNNRAPTKPSLCFTCGDLDNNMPCTRLEMVPENPFQCPADMPYCMNDIYQEAGMAPAVFKRCVDEQGCQQEWYQESSDKAACFQYDPSVYTEDLVCHLCCHGDRCNAQLLPEKSTLYKPGWNSN
ncbi:hypothetical protein BaRGS_00030592 [Batillaria attramentaria]|uniref:C-type lectin domain-containing protein n=1 Tax=Batillaria attramentaria TaxID=370345 RepID=A0ABD0JSR2_9CAEN